MIDWLFSLDWLRQVGLLICGLIAFGLIVFVVYEGTHGILHFCARCCKGIASFFRRCFHKGKP